MSDFSIGVDLRGTNFRVAAIDAHGNLTETVGLKTWIPLGRYCSIWPPQRSKR
jgi:predicted NBD/HSP70 family sugar kinase